MKLCFTAMTGLMALAGAGQAFADTPAERLRETATVLREVMSAPDQSIPEELLQQSHCIVIVPNSKSGAFFILRRSRKLTHLCSLEVTHIQNRIENLL